MKFVTLPNGNLRFVLEDSDDRLLVEDLLERTGENDVDFAAELLEATGWQGNGRLARINPEDVGGLTEAPILTDDRTIEDDGSVTVHGNVWWYPDYQVLHFGRQLLKDGQVTFRHAEPVAA